MDLQELTEEEMKTFALQHSIMFEKYNICEIVCQSKLSKFSVAMLKEICTALELDVYSITSKRKQPYMDILQRLVVINVYREPGLNNWPVKLKNRALTANFTDH